MQKYKIESNSQPAKLNIALKKVVAYMQKYKIESNSQQLVNNPVK